MGDEGVLQPEPMDRAIHTAAVFASFLEAQGVERVDAVATSAIRDAANRDELLAAIKERTGLEVRVISGAEEAWYGYLAIVNSTTLEDGFGIDVGGGSVQLMRIEGRRLREAESVRLGAVRVSEAFLPDEDASPKQIKALRKHVARTLSEFEWWGQGGGEPRLAGLGGTIRNLAAAVQKRMELPDLDVQGFVLTREALEELIEQLAERPASKRGAVRGIKPDRGDVILGGALVVAAAMEHGGFDEIEVTEAGLREGVFFERLLEDRDPPLLDDVRRESVRTSPTASAPTTRTWSTWRASPSRCSTRSRDAGLHDLASRGARAAVGRLHAARHRRDDRLRRPPPPLPVPDLELRPARVLAVGAGADRAVARWHRKGQPDAARAGRARAQGRRRAAAACCAGSSAWPSSSSAAATGWWPRSSWSRTTAR